MGGGLSAYPTKQREEYVVISEEALKHKLDEMSQSMSKRADSGLGREPSLHALRTSVNKSNMAPSHKAEQTTHHDAAGHSRTGEDGEWMYNLNMLQRQYENKVKAS